MILFGLLRRPTPHAPFDDNAGSGGGDLAPAAPVDAASAAEAAPASMHEAMWQRDELGRFAGKAEQGADGQPAPAEAAPVAKAEAPAVPAAVPGAKPAEPAAEDLTQMPEGLGAKAQERFQKLASGIKERDQQIEMLGSQVQYVQQTFQQHGVRQEQFEQAAGVIGMLNRGDYRSALAVLDEQRRQIALQLGEPLPGVDALSEFPDLRQRVDGLQMTEADALEVARLRAQQAQYQQAQQSQQQAASQQAQQAQQVQRAQDSVDQWARKLAAQDLDFPAIEALLLPRIPKMLQGVPPQAWPQVLQTQYELIKESGAAFRRAPPAAASAQAPAPLRPSGQGGAMPTPSSMYEAMWTSRAA